MHWGMCIALVDVVSALGDVMICVEEYHQYSRVVSALGDIMICIRDIICALWVFHNNNDIPPMQ